MKTIFLIDDSATMLMSLRQTLEMSGYKVEVAGDGAQALDKLKKIQKPDLIITDINMPNMNGIEFIRHARQFLRFTPILTLTTESQQSKREEAKKTGSHRLVGQTSWRPRLNQSDSPSSTRRLRRFS
jgi:two-component system, chemotaxis family, chemotaxis protein CheY